jgi:spermidine/putrescine transport system ATP-binding protein
MLKQGDDAMVFIRPESFRIANGAVAGTGRLTGTVSGEEFEGPIYHLFVGRERGRPIKVSLVNQRQARIHSAGEQIVLAYEPEKAVALPKGKLAAD